MLREIGFVILEVCLQIFVICCKMIVKIDVRFMMLSSLMLSNVALIKKQTIEFENGFNCLLGQSGAGKSIIISALSFLLGAKADKNLIRSGETSMRVDGIFTDLNEEVLQMLREWDLECDEELIITRTLSVDGKSSVKICGFPATIKMLQSLSEKLADFCGQHESVGLLNSNNHLSLLDKFAGEEVSILKEKVLKCYDELKEVEQKFASLGGNEAERAREKEILEFQVNEIENAHLQLGEEEELKTRFDFISSSEKIFDAVSEVLNKLDNQNENVLSLLYSAKNELSGLSNFEDIEASRTRIESCYYEIQDVVDVLETVRQSTEFDPIELERIDARLDLLKGLFRKYGKDVEAVLEFQTKSKARLEELENSAELLEKLERERKNKQEALLDACQKLSITRKHYAEVFANKICGELADLEMKGTSFKVYFEQKECSRNGFDDVKFMFSANVGQDVRDLHKTASGGELSRLMLAFKNVMLDKENVQTVVFDEIDSGISGQTAGRLSEKLVNISKFTQIICITHTPVVASKADNFLLVSKKVENGSTISTVRHLENEEIITEVARLIDDDENVSQTAFQHARKLISER